MKHHLLTLLKHNCKFCMQVCIAPPLQPSMGVGFHVNALQVEASTRHPQRQLDHREFCFPLQPELLE